MMQTKFVLHLLLSENLTDKFNCMLFFFFVGYIHVEEQIVYTALAR